MTRAGETYLAAALIAVLAVVVAAPMALITKTTTPPSATDAGATFSLPMALDSLVAIGIFGAVLVVGVLAILGVTFGAGDAV